MGSSGESLSNHFSMKAVGEGRDLSLSLLLIVRGKQFSSRRQNNSFHIAS